MITPFIFVKRLLMAALTGIASIVLVVGGSQSAAGATLPNPGFEAGMAGWAALSGTTVTVVQNVVHSGANAVVLSRTRAAGPAAITDSPNVFTSLSAGDTCTASGWVIGPVGYKVTYKLIAMDGTSTVKTVSKTVDFDGTWQQLPVITLVMPTGTSTADLQYSSPSFPLGRSWNLDDTTASCSSPPPPPPPPPAATDEARASGLYNGTPFASYGAYPYDYNNDGLEDVLINPHNVKGGPHLYRNDGGGHFTEVLAGQFVSRSPSGTIRNDRHGCAWGDVNKDGLPDLFCTMGADQGTLTDKANELWIQQSGGGFVNQAAAYGVTDPLGVGRGAAFLDVNHDGFLDLFVTNHTRSDGAASPNRLYINQGGTSFRDAPEYGLDVELGALPGNQTCNQVVDFNRDTWPDLFVCGHNGLKLYRNEQGAGYTDVTAGSGLLTGVWRHAVLADLNRDGLVDIAGISGNTSQFRIQLGQSAGTFGGAVVTRTIKEGRQIGIGDANGDGTQDVYIVQGALNPDILLLNSGGGTQFTEATMPQATSGAGQSVTPFDYDQNGTMDMIVLNGDSTPGPTQLISLPRA